MNCGLMFLHYRSGSTLCQHLFSSMVKKEIDIKSEREFFFPNVRPPYVEYHHTFLGDIYNATGRLTKKREHSVISVHQGNWWGNTRSCFIPAPYADISPMKWSNKELLDLEKTFPDVNFKYITVIRDGRNTAASLFNLKGGTEEKLRNEWGDEDYFTSLCLGWRNQARIALDNQAANNQYRIYKFEDIMNMPVPTLGKIFAWLGYQPDWDQLSPRIENIKQRKVGKKHTSFKDDSTLHQRFLGWEDWQTEVFWKSCKKEMKEMGYC